MKSSSLKYVRALHSTLVIASASIALCVSCGFGNPEVLEPVGNGVFLFQVTTSEVKERMERKEETKEKEEGR